MTAPVIILDNVDLCFPKLRGILSVIKDKLTKKSKSFTALKRIDLEINSGEVFGLIGKNGSGKSTILRVISGIYPPDNGYCKVMEYIVIGWFRNRLAIKPELKMPYCMVAF